MDPRTFNFAPSESTLSQEPLSNQLESKSNVVHASTGAYRVETVLGHGADSQIRLATNLGSGAQFAVKIFDKATRTEEQLERARFEGTLGMKLRHPNIIEVIEMLESPDHLMLIMPYARHGDLLDYLNRRGTLLEDEAAAILLQLISALKHAHNQNLIHFDVKLENILCMDKNVSGEERVVLADWGCAYDYKTSDRSAAAKIPRPVQYSSPELLNGDGQYGPEVDVWALGIILYALVFGELPFEGENTEDLRKRIRAAAFVFPNDGRRPVSQSCCSLITALLTPQRLMRPTLMQVRQHPWFKEALEGLYSPRFTGGIPLVPHLPQAPNQELAHAHPQLAGFGGASVPSVSDLMKIIATQSEVISKFESRITALEKQSAVYAAEIKQLETQVQMLSSAPSAMVQHTYPDGRVYEGEWLNNQKHGRGIETTPAGDQYDGQWLNDMRSGFGTYRWAEGDVYMGQWRHDKRHGHGRKEWADGRVYEGNWFDNARFGEGTYTWPDGSYYSGSWFDNKRHGRGKMVWHHGAQYEGVWNLDNRPEDAVARDWDGFFHLSVGEQRHRMGQWILLHQAAIAQLQHVQFERHVSPSAN